ncbi:phage tail protein [Achromobacter xylosoxidans]|uniref:phage tail protein n=1 Tax=Alcaligenes xylosoxydans xylosoxydans TaxID=85698 RepID=UPI001EECAA93|nr:phage tail protein [Achromobacter xylosoxidans]
MTRLLTLRRNLARLLTRDEVDDNFVNVASDFAGAVDPATLTGAYVAPYMRWADTGTGWLKRRNAANNAWEPEQRLLRRTVQPFSADELPTVDSGPVYVNGQGMAEWDAAAGKYRVKSLVPVGAVAWWPLRSSIPAGQIPADGQTVSRATFPGLASMVAAGTVPVVSEADWLADPLKRGSYTLGDGSTTIRLPDLNGKSTGSVGALFLRGDGALSAGGNGLIQRDAMQNVSGQAQFHGSGSATVLAGGNGVFTGVTPRPSYGLTTFTSGATSFDFLDFNLARVARTADETRPSNATGVWTIQAFGAVTNPGSVDAAQLASDYAVLNSAVQALQGKVFGFSQTQQNVLASRTPDVTYTNSTGRPILVAVSAIVSTNPGHLYAYVDGDVCQHSWLTSPTATVAIQFVVPAGSTYKVLALASAINAWREYR